MRVIEITSVIGIWLLILHSCKNETQITLFYDDGSPITDSIDLDFVSSDYHSNFSDTNQKASSISVRTSLINPNSKNTMVETQIEPFIAALLYDKNKSKFSFNDSLSPEFKTVEFLLVENATGEILARRTDDKGYVNRNALLHLGGNKKFLSFLFALEREYDSDDEYQAFEPISDTLFIDALNRKLP